MWPLLISTPGFEIPTYMAVISLAYSVGVIWVYRRALTAGEDPNAILDVALAAMIGGFIGSRLAHVVFEQPRFYWEHPGSIFKFWYGGFVFYGGAIGGFLGAWLPVRRRKLNYLRVGDLFAPVLAFGYALGRLGCLAAGCCYGRPTNLPWAIKFPPGVEAPSGIGLHPTQIYSSLWETGVLIGLLMVEKKGKRRKPGFLLGLWLMLHGIGRGIIEQFRDDFRGQTFIHLSLSTWLSLAALTWGAWVVSRKTGEVR